MQSITEQSRAELAPLGIEVADVRINLTELPPATQQNVYARMRAERQRLARKYRAEGGEEARRIRAEADRQAPLYVGGGEGGGPAGRGAGAKRECEVSRGEGDAEAARVYAEAHGTDPEFYTFVRSLEAYRKTIGKGTTLVVPPSHEFFRLFESMDAKPPKQ